MKYLKSFLVAVLFLTIAIPARAQLSLDAGTNAPPSSGLVFDTALAWLPSWDKSQTNSFGPGLEIKASPLWKTAQAAGATPFLSTSAEYYFTRNFGGGAEVVTLGDGSGSSTIDSTSFYFLARADNGNLAGYAILGFGYDYNLKKPEGEFGIGVAYQAKTGIRSFVDTRILVTGQKSDQNGFMARVGVGIPFGAIGNPFASLKK